MAVDVSTIVIVIFSGFYFQIENAFNLRFKIFPTFLMITNVVRDKHK